MRKEFIEDISRILLEEFNTTYNEATNFEKYGAISKYVMRKIASDKMKTSKANSNVKNTYYFSAEFLVGRSLGNNLLNLGIFDDVKEYLKETGVDFEEIEDQEEDAALGNGGLGRLAACFIESAASLSLPVQGYGVRYSQGIFKQTFIDGFQNEEGDNWTEDGDFWSIRKDRDSKLVKFKNHTVVAVPYDMPIIGYKNGIVNNLRLWQAEAINGGFDFAKFNNFQYSDAISNKDIAEDITRVLYPNDIQRAGKLLRLKQQYFFVSASIQDLVEKYELLHSDDKQFLDFYKFNIIQLNDTHPVIAIPELMRVLIDEKGVSWQNAYDLVKKCFAFTNHTVLQEALERWSIDLIDEVNPRCMQLIFEINEAMIQELKDKGIPDDELHKFSIIKDNMVEMAYLAVWVATSVNGVAALHTEIIKKDTFAQWMKVKPEVFNNKTNGITPRRWLQYSNPELSDFITELLGSDDWKYNMSLLKGLEKYKDDNLVLDRLNQIKFNNKKRLSDYVLKTEGIKLDPSSIFDIQIKRLHEYKRQLLNILHICYLYNKIKKNPALDIVPRTFIFGAKAAPGYFRAKAIIKFINTVAKLINNDPDVRDKLKVVFLQNYRVSSAEKLFPAADVSEQISTAGKEASGTGNMKFMVNGTVTLGTYDGANIEIFEFAGEENNIRFGATVEELDSIAADYNSKEFYHTDAELKGAVDMLLNSELLSDNGTFMFLDIYNELVSPQNGQRADRYYVLKDFRSYVEAQEKVDVLYRDRRHWAKMCLINLANSYHFSSDRTILEYKDDIWGIDKIDM